MARLKIPYESLDPLTIGSADDESKIYREELELEVPDENLLAAIYPEEPEPVANATEAARDALADPVTPAWDRGGSPLRWRFPRKRATSPVARFPFGAAFAERR